MGKRMLPKPKPPWWKKCRCYLQTIIIPICIFQAVLLLLIPSTIDVLILGILIGIACVLHFEWI
ncbi:hypothetical protein [Jeotgalibacillus terrae]|uniref:Uncharacterized protein n=1 Tax=Jeotgalibacillus terrae TaxID=587735 RepID=A0ABW5ZJ32_9BACL|nr:hypothetical protein [Jeotgalibacillus terrae]MBM7578853.1 hypothetical protein [Jeotgalibacillus terrae]